MEQVTVSQTTDRKPDKNPESSTKYYYAILWGNRMFAVVINLNAVV